MAQKYTKKHEVSYYECDINKTMTFPSMLGVVIKTSEEQSDHLGRGTDFGNHELFDEHQSLASCR